MRPRDTVINDEHLKLEEERGISSNNTEQERDQQTRKLDSGILQATPNRKGGGWVGVGWCEDGKLDKRWALDG